MIVLGADIGTTALKMGVFRDTGAGLEPLGFFSRAYPLNRYDDPRKSDIDPRHWRAAFTEGCRALAAWAGEVDSIALSGTTPGLTCVPICG